MKQVQLSEGTLVIPTYQLGPPDREPPLLNEFTPRGAPVYPYSTLEVLSGDRSDREYQAVFLENAYIRLTILPELNGRLYSAFDKTNDNELFYSNPVIKPGLFAVRGAWPAVGVEYNFPNSHTTTTLDEASHTVKHYEDGSASVVVGDIECTCRMGWAVEVKLTPDSNAILMESKLYNPTNFPQRYYFWINAACPVFAETEFIYPPSTRRLLTHPPMDASRLAYLEWPVHDGTDIGYFKNIKQHFPVFAESMKEDFYGIYHHNLDYGLAHVASHSLVRGRKLWMFGTARDGGIFIDQLSESGADYCELQTGPFTLQSDYRLLQPGRMYVQRDCWLPVANTGGFNLACQELAAKINVENATAEISLCSTVRLENAKVQIKSQDAIVDATAFDAKPGTCETIELACPDDSEIHFIDNSGRTLAVYKQSIARAENVNLSKSPIARETNHYLKGKYLEEQARAILARETYANADPDDLSSKLATARLAYADGCLEKAENLLDELLAIDRNSSEAWLFKANILVEKKQLCHAAEAFSKAADDNQFRDRALMGLARLETIRRQYRKAIAVLDELTEFGAAPACAHALRALCMRKLGLCSGRDIQFAENKYFLSPLVIGENILSGERSYSLHLRFEAVCAYIGVAHYADALDVLERAEKKDDALSKYYVAWLKYQLGVQRESLTEPRLSQRTEWRQLFAFRNETEPVLRHALQVNPNDDTANYQLGCLLAFKNRWDEAAEFWCNVKEAKREESQRNLALYYWKVKRDCESAACCFKQALKGNAKSRSLIEGEMFFEETCDASARLEVFTGRENIIEEDSRVKLAYIKALLANRQAEKAFELLWNGNFRLCEGKMLSRELYENACEAMADKFLSSNDFTSAAEYYLKATKYPENIGIGKPAGNKEAEWHFKAGKAFFEAGMEAQAREHWKCGAAAGESLNIDYFPLKHLVWEAEWERIDMRYWRNLVYRGHCLIKLNKNAEAKDLLAQVDNYLNHLRARGGPRPPELAILEHLKGGIVESNPEQDELNPENIRWNTD